MKKFLYCLIIICGISTTEAKVFVAGATGKAKLDSRARIYAGDTIEKLGSTHTYALRAGDKTIKFNRYSLITFVEGFNPKKKYGNSIELNLLKRNRSKLVEFAKRFPKAQAACDKEILIVDAALEKMANGETYLSGKWQSARPSKSASSPTANDARNPPESAKSVNALGNFKTRSGQLIIDGTVTKVEGDRISVAHDTGLSSISIEELPSEIAGKFGLTAKSAAEARANRAAETKKKAAARVIWLEKEKLRKAPYEHYKVIQVVGKNVLASSYYRSGWVYLVDANLSGELVEDMEIRLKSVKDGTYSYTTVGGASKTVQQRLVKTEVNTRRR